MPSEIDEKDVLQRIRDASLSPSQEKVTHYLLQGGLDVVHYTIAEIAEAIEVNASTVVRTAQSLGYPGFPEFQDALRSQFLRQARLSQRLRVTPSYSFAGGEAVDDKDLHILDRILRDEIQNLLDMPHHISYDTFDQIVDLLDEAQHVYIIGLGASFPVALSLGIVTRYARDRVIVLTPGIDPIAAQLADIGPGDLLVSICFSRYTRETLMAMDFARRQGVTVVAITDALVSPPAKRADHTLVVSYRYRLHGNAVAIYALLDALLGSLFERYPERIRRRLDHLEELFETFHILSDDWG